jgi:ethanolamine utilization protein EutA
VDEIVTLEDDAASDGGRVFFSNTSRSLMEEDVVELTSVGVDIGSSTSHLAISKITLERLDSGYVITGREVLHESDITLTPYRDATTIDADALGVFIEGVFGAAGMAPDDIDTGALILTGVAVRRRNARAVGELFAGQAGKFVAVSAGDALETVMAAYGSGAIALSIRDQNTVMNIDIGGGTSKIAICRSGDVVALTAIDVGARLFVFDDDSVIVRIEDAGHAIAAECGLTLGIGDTLVPDVARKLASRLADHLFEVIGGQPLSVRTEALLRLDPLGSADKPDIVTFSGGVSEYVYDRTKTAFGDLGPLLAEEIAARVGRWGVTVEPGRETIRATVIGASQYTVQVSGSTIFLSSDAVVPLRNVAVVAPVYDRLAEDLDAEGIAAAVWASLRKMDLHPGRQPVAVCLKWAGSATFRRLHALATGLVAGLRNVLGQGHPLVVVTDSDIGGLLGIHCREELKLENPIISIDGIELKEFDFIDIGEFLKQTGAVPVVIKSLVFPNESEAAGWRSSRAARVGGGKRAS